MSLSHDDVERLLRLIDASSFDELELETDGVKLTLRRRGGPLVEEPAPASAAAQAAAPAPAASPAAPATAQDRVPIADGLVEVRTPMLGTFFRAPKPGAEPFVEVGARVEPETTIGIVEVMKLMNAVHAGVSGEVVEVLVRDGELVEFDRPLLLVRPV